MAFFLASSEDPTQHVRDVILVKTASGVPLITMHMVTLVVIAVVFVFVMSLAGRAIATGPETEGNKRYLTKGRFGQLLETMIVYLRDEMLTPVMGAAATRTYLPFLMTLFFFILFLNVFGLIPFVDLQHLLGIHKLTGGSVWFGGTATANIMVTAALALIAFIVIQIHGFKDLGVKGWLLHNFGGLRPRTDLPLPRGPARLRRGVGRPPDQARRPGHSSLRQHGGGAYVDRRARRLRRFGGGRRCWACSGLAESRWFRPWAAVLITFLEVFVALLQAFIFMFLTAVFISLLSHHDEHEDTKNTARANTGLSLNRSLLTPDLSQPRVGGAGPVPIESNERPPTASTSQSSNQSFH